VWYGQTTTHVRRAGNRPLATWLHRCMPLEECYKRSDSTTPTPVATITHRHKTRQKGTHRSPHFSCLWRGQATISQARGIAAELASSCQAHKASKRSQATNPERHSSRCSSYLVSIART